jgi:hypothetical protein
LVVEIDDLEHNPPNLSKKKKKKNLRGPFGVGLGLTIPEPKLLSNTKNFLIAP